MKGSKKEGPTTTEIKLRELCRRVSIVKVGQGQGVALSTEQATRRLVRCLLCLLKRIGNQHIAGSSLQNSRQRRRGSNHINDDINVMWSGLDGGNFCRAEIDGKLQKFLLQSSVVLNNLIYIMTLQMRDYKYEK